MQAIDPAAKISRHFTFHEALWLPAMGRLARETDGLNDEAIANIADLLGRVDQVLDHFGWRAKVHCCYRPPRYNLLIGGARDSAHKADRPGVAAIDFHPIAIICGIARQMVMTSGLLESLSLRMEDNGPSGAWIHLDSAPVPQGGSRVFKVSAFPHYGTPSGTSA